jgi:hypothetical protein
MAAMSCGPKSDAGRDERREDERRYRARTARSFIADVLPVAPDDVDVPRGRLDTRVLGAALHGRKTSRIRSPATIR